MRPSRFLVAAAAATVLAACSILPKSESPDIYLLPATVSTAAIAAPVDWSLRVDTPQASRSLDSTRIAVLHDANVITNYQGARWNDNAPIMLRNRLLDAFRADGRIRGLSSDDGSLQADLELGGDLSAFQSEYHDGKPDVVVRYEARLVNPHNRRIVATRSFEVRQPVNGTAIPQVVTAFGQASDALAGQLVAWTMQQGASQPAPKKF
jgi:cholesterol transport system auxiliary component